MVKIIPWFFCNWTHIQTPTLKIYKYVCNATTFKNDIQINSSFFALIFNIQCVALTIWMLRTLKFVKAWNDECRGKKKLCIQFSLKAFSYFPYITLKNGSAVRGNGNVCTFSQIKPKNVFLCFFLPFFTHSIDWIVRFSPV